MELNFLEKRQQTKDILKEFLLLVSEYSVNKNDVVGCQALIYSNEKGQSLYLGADSEGFVKDKKGIVKNFKLQEIVGLVLSLMPGVVEAIEEELETLLKKVEEDFKIEQKNVIIIITTDYTTIQDIQISVFDKTEKKGNIDMVYIFPEPKEIIDNNNLIND